jgi:hypothetical protein
MGLALRKDMRYFSARSPVINRHQARDAGVHYGGVGCDCDTYRPNAPI